MSPYERIQIADVLVIEKYKAGEIVIHEVR